MSFRGATFATWESRGSALVNKAIIQQIPTPSHRATRSVLFYFYIAHWLIWGIDNALSVCNNVIVQSVGKNKKGGVSDGRFYFFSMVILVGLPCFLFSCSVVTHVKMISNN